MSGSRERMTALVLAGRRGASDALADALAASDASGHHALLDVAGVPMLVRVVRALRAAPQVGRIVVVIDAPEVLAGEPELRDVEARTSASSPSRRQLNEKALRRRQASVAAACSRLSSTSRVPMTKRRSTDSPVWAS